MENILVLEESQYDNRAQDSRGIMGLGFMTGG
jgi:hypothetical protein